MKLFYLLFHSSGIPWQQLCRRYPLPVKEYGYWCWFSACIPVSVLCAVVCVLAIALVSLSCVICSRVCWLLYASLHRPLHSTDLFLHYALLCMCVFMRIQSRGRSVRAWCNLIPRFVITADRLQSYPPVNPREPLPIVYGEYPAFFHFHSCLSLQLQAG